MELETEPIGQYDARWPELSRIQHLCRKYSASDDTEWTLARYREAWYLDRYIAEQMELGASREEVLARVDEAFPGARPMWVKWANQHRAGTIQIPAGWCDRCQGDGLIAVWREAPNVSTKVCVRHERCPVCRRVA